MQNRRQRFWRGPASAVLGIAVVGLVAGCTETRQALGLDKNPPDEFRVVARAPLAMPPEYTLRPPTPGATRPQEGSVTSQARQTLIGQIPSAPAAASHAGTAGERALLTRTGALAANPAIRSLVERETAQMAEDDKTFMDRVIFWRGPDDQGDVVDAAKENQRLKQNAALGRAPTAGETPTIRRKKRGALEGIF